MNLYKEKKILLVDDDAGHRLMLKATLGGKGYQIFEAADGETGLAIVEDQFFDLILLDLKMKKMDGIKTLQGIKKISPAIPVILMTAYASVKTAVQGLKLGAFDYMVKPLDMDEVLLNIEKALNFQQMKIENKVLKERLDIEFEFSSIIGNSKKMHEVFEVLAMAAPSDATIIIFGESGTGKELIANAIHQNSLRRDKIFVKVNCAALAENLLESELFGHEKGAFTGAVSRRLGRFELADGGTLFLDEIGDMSLATQAKILRVLQEGEFERLGSERTIRSDLRIIAATNKNLGKEVEEGNFRKDLFFRLSVVPVQLPALQDRKEDIPALAENFLKKYAQKNNRLLRGFTPAAMDLLMRYDWPGNVRELENLVERAVILSREDFVSPEALPLNVKQAAEEIIASVTDGLVGRSIKEVERELILKTLEQTGKNITRAAKILGLTRRGLQYKLKELDVT